MDIRLESRSNKIKYFKNKVLYGVNHTPIIANKVASVYGTRPIGVMKL